MNTVLPGDPVAGAKRQGITAKVKRDYVCTNSSLSLDHAALDGGSGVVYFKTRKRENENEESTPPTTL